MGNGEEVELKQALILARSNARVSTSTQPAYLTPHRAIIRFHTIQSSENASADVSQKPELQISTVPISARNRLTIQ